MEGRARRLPPRPEGGLQGVVFTGLCSLVANDLLLDTGRGVFVTRHSADLKFIEVEGW